MLGLMLVPVRTPVLPVWIVGAEPGPDLFVDLDTISLAVLVPFGLEYDAWLAIDVWQRSILNGAPDHVFVFADIQRYEPEAAFGSDKGACLLS